MSSYVHWYPSVIPLRSDRRSSPMVFGMISGRDTYVGEIRRDSYVNISQIEFAIPKQKSSNLDLLGWFLKKKWEIPVTIPKDVFKPSVFPEPEPTRHEWTRHPESGAFQQNLSWLSHRLLLSSTVIQPKLLSMEYPRKIWLEKWY